MNDVRTGATPEYPDLQGQRFKRKPDEVFAAVYAVVNEMQLDIVRMEKPERIEAVATTSVLRFKDDVTIALHRDNDVTVVHVRSKSRIGRGDFGTNARRIRDFQAKLAARLPG